MPSRPLVGAGTESSEVVQETLHPQFFLPLHAARAPHQFSEHRPLRSHFPPFCGCPRIDVVGTIVFPRINVSSQEAVGGSAQHVVVARARLPRDAAEQHYLEYLGS